MKENRFRVLSFLLSILCAMGFALYASETAKATAGKNALNAVYQRSFYEATETLQSMQVTLKKLSQAGSGHLEIEYLSDVSKMAQSIQENLSALPIAENAVSATVKFVNQAGDFSGTLLKKIASGGAISLEDRETLSQLLASVTELTLKMDDLLKEYLEGGKAFRSNDLTDQAEDGLSPLTDPMDVYPVLLYDGPFSDSIKHGEMKAVNGRMHTIEMAEEKLGAFFDGEAQGITLAGINQGEVEIYEFSFTLGGIKAYAGVTRTGGHIVYVLPEYAKHKALLTEEECTAIAADFLKQKGFGEFEAAYYRKYDGAITVNLAPVENGIILYPDLIKVEVSMETGRVIGLEATNYFTNHTRRNPAAPTVSAPEAESRLGDSALTGELRLCIIPFGNGERLAYEAQTVSGRDRFLVYIDAHKGYEIEIFQLVDLDEGTIVQ